MSTQIISDRHSFFPRRLKLCNQQSVSVPAGNQKTFVDPRSLTQILVWLSISRPFSWFQLLFTAFFSPGYPGAQTGWWSLQNINNNNNNNKKKTSLAHTKAHLVNEWNINDSLIVVPLAGWNWTLTQLFLQIAGEAEAARGETHLLYVKGWCRFFSYQSNLLCWCMNAGTHLQGCQMISAEWRSQERGSHGSLCPVTSLADGMGTSSGSWHQCHFLEINEIVQIHTDLETPGDDATLSLKRFGRSKMKTDYWMKLKPKVI